MEVWIEDDYVAHVVTVWHKENPYGTKADVPVELIKNLEQAAEQYKKAQQAILEYVN